MSEGSTILDEAFLPFTGVQEDHIPDLMIDDVRRRWGASGGNEHVGVLGSDFKRCVTQNREKFDEKSMAK
jgi:hypothetical protein